MSGLVTATCFDWPTCQLSRGALCVIPLKIHGNYRSCIYSVATVIQREKEALSDEYGGGLANALLFL